MRDLPAMDIFEVGESCQISASGRFARATLGVMGSPEETFILFHLNIVDRGQCDNNRVRSFLDTGPAALMLLLCCEKRARGPLNTRHSQVLASRLNIYSQSRVTIMRHVMANIVLKLVTILPAKFFFKSTEFIFGCPLV